MDFKKVFKFFDVFFQVFQSLFFVSIVNECEIYESLKFYGPKLNNLA